MGCLGIIVVLILAVIVGLVVARPMLEARWKQWRAENPWADVVLGAASAAKEMAGAAVGDEEAADTTVAERKPPKRLEGVNDKRAMPDDLPLWPRPRTEVYSAGQGHAAAFLRVREPYDSVLRYYRRAMPDQGWQLTAEQKGAGGTLLLYQKAGRTARVEVVGADTGMTEIWLRSRVPEKPKQR